jgi:sugar/nucleoside kinase (ribokinase family)
MKHGERGASWIDARGTRSVPSAATAVVDTVGAGDALDAGVIDAVLRGLDREAALREGSIVAARAIAHTGARP